MKKFSLLLVLALVGLLLVSCGGNNNNNNDDDGELFVVNVEKYENYFQDKKVYITSIGQADLPIAENYLTNAVRPNLVVAEHDKPEALDADVISNNLLEASEVEEGSLVILVIGASGKGLQGAGNRSVEDEVARAEQFVNRKEAGEIEIMVMHIGGEGRTGQQSDPIIDKTVPKANFSIVYDANNGSVFRGKFSKHQSETVDVIYFSSIAEVMAGLKVIIGERE